MNTRQVTPRWRQ